MSVTILPGPEQPLFDGRFAIEGLLGRGGMAEVYRARDLRHDRPVAIKVMRQDVLDAIGIERFRREIMVTGSFSHPHILPLLESGETAGKEGRRLLYYVMPLIEGETLRDLLARDDHLSVDDAVRIAHEVLEALRYAHDAGVIHRDIKPANILLSGGHAVVADFGIARPVARRTGDGPDSAELTVSGIAVGTPEYMSPEQAFGGQQIDGRCDVYAVGCVLYEMLVGMPPFHATTGAAIVSRKVLGAFMPASAMRPTLPKVLDEIIARAIRPDPVDRYPSAEAFLAALDGAADVRRGSGQFAPVPRPAATRRRLIGAVVTLPVVALGVILAWRSHTEADMTSRRSSTTADPARVAVLPFENLSADTSLRYVANGMTSDLIDELAQVKALTVISRNGVLPFVGKSVGVDSIARALKVGSIITGDVRRAGDRVSVSVRLVDGGTGRQIASHDTSGTGEDLLGVRSVVIDDVARFLRQRLGEQVRIATTKSQARSPESWQLVERVRTLLEGELPSTYNLPRADRARRFAHADSLMVRAARLDRAWAEPLVQRARLALALGVVEEVEPQAGDTEIAEGPRVARRLWTDAVTRSSEALSRDARNAGALRARGRARTHLWRTASEGNVDSLRVLAEADLRAAVEHRPDYSEAWENLSFLLHQAGDFTEAERAAQEALRADEYLSNAAGVLTRLQLAALGAEHTERAIRWCAEGRRRYRGDARFAGCELTTIGWAGSTAADVARGWTVLAEAERGDTDGTIARSGWATRRLFIAAAAARAGMRDSASAILGRTNAALRDSAAAVDSRVESGRPSGATQVSADLNESYVRALLGQTDASLRLLESYLKKFPIQRRWVAATPWFKTLRTNPRFAVITAMRQ